MTNIKENWPLYSCLDAATAFEIWESVSPELSEGQYDYTDTYRRTMALYDPIIYMTTRGLGVNKDEIENAKERVGVRRKKAQNSLNEMSGIELNANSPKQCIAYFYGTLGYPPYKNNGSITTDDKALARLARKGCKEAKLVQEVRTMRKLEGTYLEVILDKDGRLRCSWNIRGTRMGRLSSSQTIFDTGLNLQNLHSEFKPFIVADEGMMFFELDKRQSEWVITAYVSNDRNMIDIVESGVDPHAATANAITGLPEELIIREAKELGFLTDEDMLFENRKKLLPEIFDATFLPRSMVCRQAGKKSNHALNYKEGYKRFALENELPETESRIIVNRYRDRYCNLPIWWDEVINKLSKDRVLVNCFGRPYRFLDEWGYKLWESGIAFIPQSTNADILIDGMVDTYNDRESFMLPIDMLAQIHDSILNQYPIGDWNNMAKAILRYREHLTPTLTYDNRIFTVKTDLKIGLNWGVGGKDNKQGMLEIEIIDNVKQMAELLEASYAKIAR